MPPPSRLPLVPPNHKMSDNVVKVTKFYSLLSHVQVVFLCKFGQNPPFGSGDRVQTMLIFTVFIVW